uniref:Uncharacterized protein n=1 Tax=Romanomermis culicivorax TaxID=13658 RepID=A0A915KWD3_ROMCU
MELPMITYMYCNETKQTDFRIKSDILDADDESKVQSVQVDEEVMELESEEEVDSMLLEEKSCKQVNDEDALLYISITNPEVAESVMTASSVMQLQPQPQVVTQLQTEMLPPQGLPMHQVIQASTMDASQYLSSVENQAQSEEIPIAQDEQNMYGEAFISQYMDAESAKKKEEEQTAVTPIHTVVETPQELGD